MTHLVLGTAGHIDHGKSALVLALTGIDPDRLKEEKQRGITIELGFADLDLGDGRVISFVDVPGHERFVRQMVAGATGIDAVLLVVAADQGVQPQTREHLDVCALLGLERGIVALTKSDLVEPELREVVALELAELFTGTFLESAPIVEVSARTGDGLDALREALAALLDQSPRRSTAGIARLPVDRSFVLKGFGTVVTGTLVSGSFAEGDEVEVLPSRSRGRIRGLQVHRKKVDAVTAGQRAAINLQGLDCSDVPRGSTISRCGALRPTRRAWARLTLLPDAPANLESGGAVRFHQGTCQREARFRVFDRSNDGSLSIELYLGVETALTPGDRFILRRPAPVDTVGGGVIVDVDPPSRRQFVAAAFSDEALESHAALALRLSRAGEAGSDRSRLTADLGLTVEQLEALAVELEATGELVRAAAGWFSPAVWCDAEQRTRADLETFHADEPLRRGMSREELRGRCCPKMSVECWRLLLTGLAGKGEIRLDGDQVSLKGHDVVLSGDDRELATRIEQGLRQAGLDPPALDQLVSAHERERGEKITTLLLSRGQLVKVADGKLFHAEALAQLRDKLRTHARSSRTIDVAGFKTLAGITRKNAIPLLEYLDAEKTTRRVGNLREILD